MEIIAKIENINGQNVVSSRVVAEQLGKEHSKVIRSIEQLIVSPDVATPLERYFIASEYVNEQNKQLYKEYLLTKDGFTLFMFNI